MTEREEFERWAAKRVGLSQDGRVNYAYGATRDAWEVWQARAELGTPHCTKKLNALHLNHIALQAEYDALRKDAERWRWMRNEAWGGNNKRGPYLVTFKAGHSPSLFTMLAEGAADSSIDAAMGKENA